LTAHADVAGAGRRINETLALAILRLRPQGVCAGDVGARAGISHSRLSRFQNGWEQPAPEVAERIAAVLGVPVEQLWPDLPHNETTAAGTGDRDVLSEA
jgi:lambda repressor-like predicted transcriptional regulator